MSTALFKAIALNTVALLVICTQLHECLIITSVLAGDKKFKTISFHTKLLKPLTFEKEMPLTEFRRHRTMRPPKFDIDVNIPIKLPLEDEYAKEEPRKPVESNLFFQTHEIREPAYPPKNSYQDKGELAYAASNVAASRLSTRISPNNLNAPERVQFNQNNAGFNQQQPSGLSPRSDNQPQQTLQADTSNNYQSTKGYTNNYYPEFVPGGFVNLQLSGPTGGPKMTYEDYDREKWAQQLSQAPGAMPYPILNYQQLQNYYGGLGTFTNGLPDNRYEASSLLDKFKSGFGALSQKLHLG